MDYRFLEHTADIMFEAYGKSYPEALQNAARAMFELLGKSDEKETVEMSVSSQSIEEMTVDLLSDLLSHMDAHEMIFSRIAIEEFDERKPSVRVIAYGEKIRPRISIKAVTYHELMVKKDDAGWTIRILLDV